MDVSFKCPHCEQELSVDSSASGSQIPCPTCGGNIVIPTTEGDPIHRAPHIINAMASSAAAKEEKHFKVPVHEGHTESLIAKPLAPMEVASKAGISLRIKTIRRSECVEVNKDRFDQMVSDFLEKIGEHSVVSLHTVNYTHMDLATRAWINDYGVLIVYRG